MVRDALAKDLRPFRSAIEEVAAEKLGVDPNLVIAHHYRIQSVREQSRNSEGMVYIVRDDGTPVPFEEESTLFRSIDEAQKDEYLDIYAPVEFGDAREKGRRLRELDEVLGCSIEEEVAKALEGGERS